MADPFSENFGNALIAGVRQSQVAQDAIAANALRTRQLDMQQREQNALLPLQVQQAQTGIAVDQQRIQAIKQESKLQAMEYARSVSQEQLAQEAAETRAALMEASSAYAKGDAASFAATLAKHGLDPAQFPMENAPAYFAIAEGSLDVWDGLTQGPKPPGGAEALQWRAQQAGLQPGSPEYQSFMMNGGKAPEGMVLETGADGTVRLAQGSVAAGGKPFTEAQSKDNVYSVRAQGALELLDSVGAEALTSRTDRALDAVPLGIGREAQGDAFQVAQQAGDEFLQAILRKDTGAAITPGEQALYGKTYLPQPGDKPAVIEAKRAARLRAIEAVKSGASVQQITAQERALVESARKIEETRPEGAAPAGSPSMPTRLRFNPETGELE